MLILHRMQILCLHYPETGWQPVFILPISNWHFGFLWGSILQWTSLCSCWGWITKLYWKWTTTLNFARAFNQTLFALKADSEINESPIEPEFRNSRLKFVFPNLGPMGLALIQLTVQIKAWIFLQGREKDVMRQIFNLSQKQPKIFFLQESLEKVSCNGSKIRFWVDTSCLVVDWAALYCTCTGGPWCLAGGG